MKKLLATMIDHHARLILLVLIAITIAMVPGLKKIKVVSQSLSSFSGTNEYSQSVNEVIHSFGLEGKSTVLVVTSEKGHNLTEAEPVELIQNITNKLKLIPTIKRDSLVSLATVSDVEKIKDEINTMPLLANIPQSRHEQLGLREKIQKNNLIYGSLISKDFKTTLIVFTSMTGVNMREFRDSVLAALATELQSAKSEDSPYRLQIAGESEVQYQLETNIQKDATLFLLIAIALILGSFYFMFKTWKGVLLILLSMVMGIIWTMGAVGYYNEPIFILSAMLPVVVVVVGSAYAIYVYHKLVESYQQTHHHFYQALDKTFYALLSPLTVSAVTTIIGGLSLLSFKLRMIQHFGIFVAVGSAFTYLISVFFIPALFKVYRARIDKLERGIEKTVGFSVDAAKILASSAVQMIPIAGPVTHAVTGAIHESLKQGVQGFVKQAKSEHLIERGLSQVAKYAIRSPWKIIVTISIALILGVLQLHKLKIGFDDISLLPNNYEVKKVMLSIEKKFNGLQSFDVLIDSGSAQGALEPKFLERVDQFGREASQIPEITKVFSVADILKRMHKTLSSDGTEFPNSRELIAQYFLLLDSSSAAASLRQLVTIDQRKVRITLTTNVTDTEKVEKVYEKLKSLGASAFAGTQDKFYLGGALVGNVGLLHYVVWGKVQNIMISILFIFLFVALLYRSISRSLLSILCVPVVIILNFGLMSTLGIRLDITTAIITSFAMGIGVDFSLHFLSAVKDEYEEHKNFSHAIEGAVKSAGLSIVYNALSMVFGFSALMFSRFTSINTFAVLMSFNMLAFAVLAVTLLPATIRITEPDYVLGNAVAHHRRKKMEWGRVMKIAFVSVFCVSLFAGIIVVDAKAGEKLPDPEALLKKSVKAMYTNNEESIYVMKLMSASGDTTTRKMKVWFKSNNENDAKLLIKFIEPADIRGTGFLTIGAKGKSVDQYLYLPALKKARKLGGTSNSDEPFLGSDFSMGDLSVEKSDGLEYKVTGVKKCDGSDCYEVVGTPKAGSSGLTYSKKVYLIKKDSGIATRGEFYNAGGQLEKVMSIKNVSKEGPIWVVNQVEMKNQISNHSTLLEFEKRDRSKKLSDSLFTVSNLERN